MYDRGILNGVFNRPRPGAADGLGDPAGVGAANRRNAGLARCASGARRAAAAARTGAVQRHDRAQRAAVDALLAGARRSARGGAERRADPARRRGLRLELDLRRRDPDAEHRRARRRRTALHQRQLHRPLLAVPGRAPDRSQPSLHGLRRRLGTGDGLPGLQQPDVAREGDDRQGPDRERLRQRLVGQEPQHPRLPGQPIRPLRPMADRHGLRLFLRLQRRRHLAVAARPALPQHDADLSLYRPAGLQPRHRHGRRRDRLDPPADRARPEQALLRLLRPRRHPRAAPPDRGLDRQDQRHAPLRRRLEPTPRDDLRQPEAARRDPRDRRAHPPGPTTS